MGTETKTDTPEPRRRQLTAVAVVRIATLGDAAAYPSLAWALRALADQVERDHWAEMAYEVSETTTSNTAPVRVEARLDAGWPVKLDG